jgi:hypothetical protein
MPAIAKISVATPTPSFAGSFASLAATKNDTVNGTSLSWNATASHVPKHPITTSTSVGGQGSVLGRGESYTTSMIF